MELMRMPIKALLIALSTGTLLLAGCNPPMPSGIKKIARVKTVVSLCPSAAELLSLGVPKTIGISSRDNFPPTLKGTPIVADIKPNYELLAKLKPDLIVYDPAVYNAQDIENLKALKIPLVAIDGDTVEAYTKSVYRLGQALQSETAMMDYLDRLDKEVKVCLSDPLKPAPKIAIVMSSPTSSPMVAGSKSFYCDLIRVAGAEPVGPDSNDFKAMSPEALLALNPDGIVLPAEKGSETTFMSDRRFTQLKAVKNGKVFMMNQDYLLRRGERVDEALKRLHDEFIKLFK